MTGVLTIDHPAWHHYPDGARARAVQAGSGLWVMSYDGHALRIDCVEGSEDIKPSFVATDPADPAGSRTAALRNGLTELGVSQRLANPRLWDAITTAILRQVVRADQARKALPQLVQHVRHNRGRPVRFPGPRSGPHPSAQPAREQLRRDRAKFHRTALQAAAEQYEQHHETWQHLDATALVTALTGIPRIGRGPPAQPPPTSPGTSASTRTTTSPCAPGDRADRARASWPDKKDKSFGPLWTGWAGAAPPPCTPSRSPPSPGGRTHHDLEDPCASYR
ncbi:hypothetical protein ACRAWF_26670 [Streptomyces sp. L7]